MGSKGYIVGEGYEMPRPKFQPVQWSKQVWNNWCIPKHQFVGWLIARQALQLKEKLFALGITADDTCILCGSDSETAVHLFQKCRYSSKIMDLLAQMGGFVLPQGDLLNWLGQMQGSALRKGILLCLVQAIYCQIWIQRNKARIEGCILRPEIAFKLVIREVQLWVRSKIQPCIDIRDREWLVRFHMIM
ncbi:uncharacterized protein LOC141587920 [Silene latifolia]|uniref:uncharacterized protein LOC141587920 n=1 Tax=Silene latifolia TaxID=37657 RepID=UPI003D781696